MPARKTRTAPPGAGAKVCREAALGSASKASHLGCHGTRYVRYGRGWYAYPVRTVHGALGASRPAPPVRHGRLVRVARTYQLEAARRTRQLSERLERVDRFRAVRGGSPLHLRHRPARKARLQRVRSVPRRHSQGELRALGRHRGQREQRWLQHDTRARSCRRAGRNQRTFWSSHSSACAAFKSGAGIDLRLQTLSLEKSMVEARGTKRELCRRL